MPDHLTAEGHFAYFALQGHVYFALACDVQRDAVPEVAEILELSDRAEGVGARGGCLRSGIAVP